MPDCLQDTQDRVHIKVPAQLQKSLRQQTPVFPDLSDFVKTLLQFRYAAHACCIPQTQEKGFREDYILKLMF
jgi:hypothetical protein